MYRPLIEWVQDTAAATTTWGDIGDWDVSGVGDFSFAFSKDRDATGGSLVANGNPKASTFVGTAMSKWTTTSVTTLECTFKAAGEMKSDLSGWNVAKVTSLMRTFQRASKFTGAGLVSWDTAAVTTLFSTFYQAGEMNSDLSGWNVAKVTTLEYTFSYAFKFAGTGLPTWDVAKVTNMGNTFTSPTSKDITSCNKRQIADAWNSNSAFNTWNTAWATDACPPPLTDATFKQASWGT
jgi:surface protein